MNKVSDALHTIQLVWTGRFKLLSSCQVLLTALMVCNFSCQKMEHQDTARWSYWPVHVFHQNYKLSVFLAHLEIVCVQTWQNVTVTQRMQH